MKKSKLLKQSYRIADRFCIREGKLFRLDDFDPADTNGVKSEEEAGRLLQESTALLADMQEKLYAQDHWALLLILQGMDAAGKDSVIKHVMSGVNPQGCDVHSFKTPSHEELNHDYLWRAHKVIPERGKIGIFNRSYYEEVLIVRVHQDLLNAEMLPDDSMRKDVWDDRYEDINTFERYLSRNGIVIRKFFLHISKEEQRKRFLKRLDDPKKNWKFSMDDIKERTFWKDYKDAYEKMVRATATAHAPWYVVPADNKWFARLIVAYAAIDALSALDLVFPKIDKEKKHELDQVRRRLLE